jgi:hypothetical protein
MRSRRPRQWRKLVEATPPGRLATWLGRLATTWRQTDFSKLVELPHGPINTPLRWKWEHTPHFRDYTCKALILSVVDRRSLVGRVARLWGLEGLSAYREPSSYLERGSSAGIHSGLTDFLSSSEILRIPTESRVSSPSGVLGFWLVGIPMSLPRSGWFTNHSKLSNHFSYVICAFTYRML